MVEVKAEAERLGIELVFLPPYSLELNPIEYIWKSIKKVISTTFVQNVLIDFLALIIIIFVNDYKSGVLLSLQRWVFVLILGGNCKVEFPDRL